MATFAAAAASSDLASGSVQDPSVKSPEQVVASGSSSSSRHGADDTTSSGKKAPRPRIETLILDAGALIMQVTLAGLAAEYYIPPQVVEELKHASGRNYLDSLRLRPDFNLHVVQPSSASMVIVSDFARKTGDIAVLSRQDLEVIALTYEREVARHGTKRIRTEVGGKTGKEVEECGAGA